jgi:hypothetical protein
MHSKAVNKATVVKSQCVYELRACRQTVLELEYVTHDSSADVLVAVTVNNTASLQSE